MRFKKGKRRNRLLSALLALCMMTTSVVNSTVSVEAASASDNFFYNIQKITAQRLALGDILYISTNANLSDPNFVAVQFPDTLSASLEVVDPNSGDYPNHSSNLTRAINDASSQGYDVSTYYAVKIINKAPTFDTCTNGWIFLNKRNNTWHYYCWNGGVVDGGTASNRVAYYGYEIDSATIDDSNISITAPNPASDKQTYAKNDLIVNVTVEGQTFTLNQKDFNLTNADVDKSQLDATLKIQLANGEVKEKVFNTFAQEAVKEYANTTYVKTDSYKNDYYAPQQKEIQDIIDSAMNNLKEAKSQTEIDAITAYMEADIKNVNKKAAADIKTEKDFKDSYGSLITKQYVNDSDCIQIDKALAEYADMSDVAKGKLAVQYQTLLDEKQAADWDKAYGTIIDQRTAVDSNDLQAIHKALNAFEAMTTNEKSHVDPNVITDLKNKKNAAEWNQKNKMILDATEVDEHDVTAIEAAIQSYDALTLAEKAYTDNSLKDALEAKLAAAKWNAQNSAIVNKTTPINDGDEAAIQNALSTFNNLDSKAQAYIDHAKVNDLKTKLQASAWDKGNGAILDKKTPVDKNDLTDIDKAIDEFSKLSKAQQDMIDANVIENLNAKKKAAEWDKANSAILDKTTPVDRNDLAAIDQALNELKNVDKSLVDASVIENLNAKKKAAEWDKANSAILDKTTPVDRNDLAAIDQALNDLKDIDKDLVDANVIKNLNAKKNAAEWNKANSMILDKEAPIDEKDLDSINKALDEYNALDTSEKALINQDIIKDLQNKKDAADWIDANKNNVYADKVTGEDLDSINKALEDFAMLDDKAKEFVDTSMIEDLMKKQKAATFLHDNSAILTKTPITLQDKTALNAALKDFAQLSDHEKAFLDTKAVDALMAQKEAIDFLDKYKDVMNKEQLSSSDLAKLNEALKAYGNLSDEARKMLGSSVLETLKENKKHVEKILTGDETNISGYTLLSLVSLVGFYMMFRKQRRLHDEICCEKK